MTVAIHTFGVNSVAGRFEMDVAKEIGPMSKENPALSLPFMERLAPADRAALDLEISPKRFGREEFIITQNDESTDVFFVLEGCARATIFSENGKVVAYRDIPTGAMFGELSAIDLSPRSASVVAVTDMSVGKISRDRFREFIQDSPGFNWAILEYLALQARWMTERIFEFSTMLVSERLVQELLRFAEAAGVADNQALIEPAPTHYDLALRISTHREAVSREMSKLGKQGVISKQSGGLRVHDVDALRALADSQSEI